LPVFAALLGVPDELVKAAQVDGAAVGRTFASVVWRIILPTVLSAFLLKVVIGSRHSSSSQWRALHDHQGLATALRAVAGRASLPR
jgi:ABC-type Fe3+ transport system permease subunit